MDHKRTETAHDLDITPSHLVRLMNRFVAEDPEFKKEFWSPEISMKLKEASCRKTRKKNRLKFIKENKHLILQAYHQNSKLDRKAAKNFLTSQTRTFAKWREEVEETMKCKFEEFFSKTIRDDLNAHHRQIPFSYPSY